LMKLFGKNIDPFTIDDKTPWILGFGPDICNDPGVIEKKKHLHVRFNVNNPGRSVRWKEHIFHLKKKIIIDQFDDFLTHTYTLVVQPNYDYEVRIDGKVYRFEDGSETKGSLFTDLDWEHHMIDKYQARDFKPDAAALHMPDAHYIGMESWQLKGGSVFDNFLVTSSLTEAGNDFVKHSANRQKEKFAREEFERKKREDEEAHRKKMEEERRKHDYEMRRHMYRDRDGL